MPKLSPDAYDAVIIGAGIGGLVCGCYLAKAGMKVLIAEQHHKPGGYCTSFKRKGYTFDAAAHSFGGYREGGLVRKVFQELGVDTKLNIEREDPSDIIITPDFTIAFKTDIKQTIEEFRRVFPDEGNNIELFFSFLMQPDPNAFSRIRSWTFQRLLQRYFCNERLIRIIAAPLLGNGGLPPSQMAAFIGAKIFSEFMLDGGYYPRGGMQAIPDALSTRFRELGGELRMSSAVRKIKIKNGEAIGIVLEQQGFISSRLVISNTDARQTYLNFIGRAKLDMEFRKTLGEMIPSMSDFIVYLGLDKAVGSLPHPGSGLWYFLNDDLDDIYRRARKGGLDIVDSFFMRIAKDGSTLTAILPASYKGKEFWQKHRDRYTTAIMKKIEQVAIADLFKHVLYSGSATPHTLQRYTHNYKGASFGWAGLPDQLALADFRKPSFLKNFFAVGHWTTQGLGISGVTYSGRDAARIILRGKQ